MANPFDALDEPRANPFDQFDEKPPANPFDQFDTPAERRPIPANENQSLETQRGNPFAMTESEIGMAKQVPSVAAAMSAFGQAFEKAMDVESLGVSDETRKILTGRTTEPRKLGDFADPMWPFKAFNEGIILPLIVAGQTAWRLPGAIIRGFDTQVTGDPAMAGPAQSLFEAMPTGHMWFGVPTPRLAPPKPFVKPVEIKPVEGSPNPSIPRTEAAMTGDPLIDATLQHPTIRQVIENPVIDDSHTIPNSWGGSTPLDNPTTYRDRDFPKQMTIDGVTFDTAEPAVIHENVEAFWIDTLTKAGMDRPTALKVAFWNAGEVAEDAWYRAHGMDPAKVEAAMADTVNRIAARAAHDNVPADLFRDTYPDGDPAKAAPGPIDKPTPDEVAQARQIMAKHFDDMPPEPDPIGKLQEARDLGVIGPERPPITDGKPAEAAARTIAAEGPKSDKVTQEVVGGNPWRDRFEQFVGKLDTADDVKQLIREAADENGEFVPARQGDISLAHVDAIAEAAGVAADEINARGLGRTLKNDAEVRVAMQLMLQATDNVKAAAREVKADGSEATLIKLQEAIMRRDLAVEQVVGLRAEWGRTGNVIQEFLRDVKDQEGLSNFLKDKKGRTPTDLRDLADAIDTLDGAQAARLLNDLRKPTAWDKFMFYWVNALISGPVTHAKYVIANATFANYESAVVTPIAGAVGTVRRAVTGTREGVFIGEAPARMWGLVAGTPDAIMAAAKAARTGLQTPLPGEVAQNIIPKQNKGLPYQQKPIDGTVGAVIGIPSRGAAAIHSFFNFLGYRASLEAQAYRTAAKEQLSGDAFWSRRQDAVDNPTVEMMNEANAEGYRLTYISELGPAGKKISSAIKSTKIGQLLLPFTHIPFNILARGLEGTPAALLPAESRADLFGRNGAVKQDMAVARLVAGSAVGVWAVNMVANDRMTGYGPTDPKERAQWIETGHQPYSVRIGDYWYSFNRFGSLGTMLGLHANLAEAIPHLQADGEELTKALTMTVHSTGRLLEDEVGMQGLAGLIEAINEPERKGTRFVSNFAGSLLPFSSALRQTASAMDPYMRETKTVVDGLRYYIPAVREGLLLKRNWLGEPIANAGFGGDLPVPGVSAVIQHRLAGTDPIAFEMQALDLHPAAPQNHIGTVKLPPQLYDHYQTAAGALTRQVLESWVRQPNWHEMPAFAREEIFRRSISASRQQAAAMIQADTRNGVLQQGVQNTLDRINGVKPTKLKDQPAP